MNSLNKWTIVITEESQWYKLNIRELWLYRDLILMLVKRDVVTSYKQTILGPLWYFIQPILTTVVYIVVFSKIAEIPTDGLPESLFYLSGVVIWNYFMDTFTQTSDTFSANQDMFGKVYFPRLIVPLSKICSGLIKFGIQLLLLIATITYYLFHGLVIPFDARILLFPVMVLLMAVYGMGFGLIFSSLTTKYRDLKFLIQFGIQLLMYATPIIYPISSIPNVIKPYIMYNPFAHIIEGFKYIFLGKGMISIEGMLYTTGLSILFFLVGLFLFNRTEKNFMDTV